MTSELELIERGFVKQADGSWAKPSKASLQACQQASISDPVNDESELHREIIKFLTEKRWPYAHNRMDKPSTSTPGCDDFIIGLPEGRTVWGECKKGKRKLDPDQQLFHNRLINNGHQPWVWYSFKQFKATIYTLVDPKYL